MPHIIIFASIISHSRAFVKIYIYNIFSSYFIARIARIYTRASKGKKKRVKPHAPYQNGMTRLMIITDISIEIDIRLTHGDQIVGIDRSERRITRNRYGAGIILPNK